MKEIILSKRMEAVVNMVSLQSFAIADIGCDHAYVSIALIKRNITKKVIAMDVRKGPLEIANKNIANYGEEKRIITRLSNGLEALKPGEVDTIIIAGMGGMLIKGILERGVDVLKYEQRPTLILQPQSDLEEVRYFLMEQNYQIIKEKMLEDEGKIYTALKAVPVLEKISYKKVELLYGSYNLQSQDAVLLFYLNKEKEVLSKILQKLEIMNHQLEQVSEKTRERYASVKEELRWNEEALSYYK